MAGHRSLSQARAGLLPFGTLGARGSNHSRLEPKWLSCLLACLLACIRLRERAPLGTLPHAMRAAESTVRQGRLC